MSVLLVSWTREEARELGRRGGQARAAKLRARKEGTPFPGTILDAMDAAGLTGASWAAWRAFWAATFALPLDAAQLEVFRARTGRATPPTIPVREAWQIVGRRGGKSRNAGVAAMYLGCRRDYRLTLAAGERSILPVIAADRRQAQAVLGYIKALAQLPVFAPMVVRVLKEAVELATGVTIEVHTASYRTTRGYTVVGVVADELAFWRSDDSANPDAEIIGALRPGMATVAGALLLGISSPYARRGELYKAHERYWARDAADVLVWKGPSLDMNPTLDAGVVARAYEDDPIAAAAEYGAEFRRDVEPFLSLEAIEATTVAGRLELPPAGWDYVAFTDPSGGSQDAWTLAIAHPEGERAVLDLVRETRPPFSPAAVVADYAEVLQTYGLRVVQGDHYGGDFPVELFAKQGITYTQAADPKSDIYKRLLPLVNSRRVELLDHPRLRAQLLGLERRVARGGRDSIDHGPGSHDDLANAAAGALARPSSPAQGFFEYIRELAHVTPQLITTRQPLVVEELRPGLGVEQAGGASMARQVAT